MPKINKKDKSVTIDEKLYREVIEILRDESRWCDYISIVKNSDGTRTISVKDSTYTKVLMGAFLGAK